MQLTKTLPLKVLLGSLSLLLPSYAWAQAESQFSRDRGVSVRQRPRPGYQAAGIPLGSFVILPRIGTDTIYSDNIFATRQDPIADLIDRYRPDLTVESNWARHEVGVYARATINRYVSNPNENTTDYTVGARGRLDVGRASYVMANASQMYSTESRGSPNSPSVAAEPARYGTDTITVTAVHELNRLRLTGRYSYNDVDYKDLLRIGGSVVSLDFRDRRVMGASLRADYAVSPATAVYVTAAAQKRQYRLEPPAVPKDRDSFGYEASVGVNFELSALIRGELEVGHLLQSYQDATFADINGPFLRGSIDWFPTQLTSVNINAGRSVEESVASGASGYLATVAGGRVDHELRRNIILSASSIYERDDFRGIDRTDQLLNTAVSSTYLINSRLGVTAAYNYLDRVSNGTSRHVNFTENRFTGTLTLQF